MMIALFIYLLMGIMFSLFLIIQINNGGAEIRPNNLWAKLLLAMFVAVMWLPFIVVVLILEFKTGKE